jgi:hypothetical protein
MKPDFRKFKTIDLLAQTIIFAMSIVWALSYGNLQRVSLMPLMISLIATIQISSFFVHRRLFPQTSKCRARRWYKKLLIIHHLLILPSAFAFFYPLLLTCAILCVLYYGITLTEYLQIKYQTDAAKEMSTLEI